ncbi:minor tail protein [Gordonia phage Sukkupi]|uniref:Uncharacterized protein n=1 Tax=Gordonia phage Sukkupi TaxID=2653747 RepID=A0A5Q2WLE8_9CAUD|nr:minor tail protein [Gordonia phage Sukkupi]QGH79294.1 hypothetical protein SEA_SUKKUPI_51 [Gordonia phage Sukkupi]QGH80767.1 hypothetical protein SEA_YNDEXA_51 [Gordonia phage Yndexa]
MINFLRSRLPRMGDWTPTIPFPLRAAILALWAFEPVSRGVDYLTGADLKNTTTLSEVEKAFPLPVWGLFCLVSGIMILVGFAGRWRRVSILGLYFAGATYLALAVGFASAVWDRGGDGFRTPVMFLVFGLTYWLAAIGYVVNNKPRLVVVDDDELPDAKVPDGSPTP